MKQKAFRVALIPFFKKNCFKAFNVCKTYSLNSLQSWPQLSVYVGLKFQCNHKFKYNIYSERMTVLIIIIANQKIIEI